MDRPLYLSRARLRSQRGEALSAVARLLISDDPEHSAGHAHRVVWLLFQDVPDAARDFLWRAEGDGKFMILSPRPPTDPQGLFDLDTKPFAPELAQGDRLRFSLRANPTVATKRALDPAAEGIRPRGKRVDIVMDELHKLPKTERATARNRIVVEVGSRWLAAQGKRHGFKPTAVEVENIGRIGIADPGRKRGRERAGIAVLEYAGVVEVTDPDAFLSKLATGFGSAKAFGNGLMLIRRA